MTCNNEKLNLVSIIAFMKFGEICCFVLKILSGKEILANIKGHNSGTKVKKTMCINPMLNLVNVNAYIKFGETLSICSQDIERKRNFGINQGP